MAPRLLVIQNDAGDPLGRLGDWLAEAGLELEVCDASAGDPVPEDATGRDGLLVLGGGMSAGDDARAPWLPAVRALLREAVSAQVPTLAVCLGAQLLALAHGGRVEPNPDGPELGAQLVAKRSAAATDPLFRELPITPDVVQWHFDAVTALPAGAVQLASSPGCEQQAFRLGRLAWGLQFHIETTPEIVRGWAAADADRLEGYDLDLILRRSDAVHDELVDVWRPFAATFAAVVADPGSVRPAATVPVSSAAPITDPAAIRAALAAELEASRSGGHRHAGGSAGPAFLPMPGRRPDDA